VTALPAAFINCAETRRIDHDLLVLTGIDVSFDVRSDTPPGRDPDTFSLTLGRYHELLWSKPLPNGARFDLTESAPPMYLHHRSDIGEFWLSSDSV
jgi:Family of unknown function (DUF6994)